MEDKVVYHKFGFGPNNDLVAFKCKCGCMQEFIYSSEAKCHGCGVLHKIGESK